MGIRSNQLLGDNDYPELPEVEPVETADDLSDLIDEFCARHASRTSLSQLPLKSAAGVAFALGDAADAPLFAFELSLRSVRFMSGVDFDHTPESPELIRDLFAEVADGVTFGELSVTDDGVQWGWTAPALRLKSISTFRCCLLLPQESYRHGAKSDVAAPMLDRRRPGS